MKRLLFLLSIALASGIYCPLAKAIPAYPQPIKVAQPDGSNLTIFLHGDEFLNWMTCGNSLVCQKDDGYFYFADFNNNGRVVPSQNRIGSFSLPGNGANVQPPALAKQKAYEMRAQREERLGRRAMERAKNIVPATKGQKIPKMVLLIEYQDVVFSSTTVVKDFDTFLNSKSQKGNTGRGNGSVGDYYADNSTGVFSPSFEIIGPVKVSGKKSDYAAADGIADDKLMKLFSEALQLAAKIQNLAIFDVDGDGFVDDISFIFAGYDQAQSGNKNDVWSHCSDYGSSSFAEAGGMKFNVYSCTSELKGSSGTLMSGIGSFCHEYGHVQGLPDLYDTDSEENGEYLSSYFWLMSLGCYCDQGDNPPCLTSVEKEMLGWPGAPVQLTESGTYRLQPVLDGKAFYTPTTNPGEYFVYEYRVKSGWDAGIPMGGMLVYHIDKSSNIVNGIEAKQRWPGDYLYGQGLNTYSQHPCFGLVQAVPLKLSLSGDYSRSYSWEEYMQIPFPGSKKVTSYTSVDWAGNPTAYQLSSIADTGQEAIFDLQISSLLKIKGRVKDSSGNPISGAKVKLTPLAVQASTAVKGPSGLRMMPLTKADGDVFETITPSNGEWVVDNLDYKTSYLLEVQADGFNLYSNQCKSDVPGVYTMDVVLVSHMEAITSSVQKFKGNPNAASLRLGWNDPQVSIVALVEFTPEQLASYEDFNIESISYKIDGKSAKKFSILVYFDDELVCSKTVNNPVFGTYAKEDISASNLCIPKGKSMRFGYKIEGADNGYPVVLDGQTATDNLSALMSTDQNTWYDCTEYGNLVVGANVMDSNSILLAMGYRSINLPAGPITSGTTILPTLSSSASLNNITPPTSIKWFYDGKPLAEGEAFTVLEGIHLLKVVMVFEDATEETIVQEVLGE